MLRLASLATCQEIYYYYPTRAKALSRWPGERTPEGHISIAPDLAVEGASPNDTAYEVDAKVQEYLAAGVPFVWVVNPNARLIHVYPAEGEVELRLEEDVLTLPGLIPDFSCPVADLFTLPAA